MSVWNDAILYRVHRVVENIYPNGRDVDVARSIQIGTGLEMGEALGQALAAFGISMPLTDSRFAAVLKRGARSTPVLGAPRAVVLLTADGHLAMTAGRGTTIESSGPVLSVISEPEADRYVAAWFLPGVEYLTG